MMLEAEILGSNPDTAKMVELSREQLFTLEDLPFELPPATMLPSIDPDANWFKQIEDDFMKQALFPEVQGFPPLEPGDAFAR